VNCELFELNWSKKQYFIPLLAKISKREEREFNGKKKHGKVEITTPIWRGQIYILRR
jgi:hypothetical protein